MVHWHRLPIAGLVMVAMAVALVLLAPGGQDSLAQGDIIYVDAEALGPTHDGSSWDDAFTDLQAALDAAAANDEIWVAEGIYTPTAEHGGTGDRFRSFQLKNGVALYGGFDPSVGDIAFEDRDWVSNETILSGDLNGDDGPEFANNDENSYHVFFHPLGTDLDSTAILDGFTVSGGNANGNEYPLWLAGGMTNVESSPTLANCTFTGNSGYYGGGMSNRSSSSPTLTNCSFSGNSADLWGGAMSNEYASSPTLTGCTFSGNLAIIGGGMFNSASSSPEFINCAFSANSADSGGGMYNMNGSSPTLTNCTFTGNSADSGGGMYNSPSSPPELTDCTFTDNSASVTGGGMYNYRSAPTLTNCTFEGNSANDGGGMTNNSSSSPILADCTFSGNSAVINGGGMYNDSASSPTLTNCTFAGNSAEYGGGILNDLSSPELTDCTFEGDSALLGGGMLNANGSSPTLTDCTFSGNSAGNSGAGMYNADSSPTLTNCTFSGNWSDYAVGMSNWYSSPVLTNCTFSNNSATYNGGGMANILSSPALVNCSFTGNSAGYFGGGMLNDEDSSPTLTNCTFSGNSAGGGGAMGNEDGSSPVLTNSILWGDTPDEISNFHADTLPVVTFSDIQGGCDATPGNVCGTGNIDEDPLFTDPSNGDFHLLPDSPCIDAGNNGAPNLPDFDFEGDDRILDGDGNVTAIVDMGVDEVAIAWSYFHIHLPLVLRGY